MPDLQQNRSTASAPPEGAARWDLAQIPPGWEAVPGPGVRCLRRVDGSGALALSQETIADARTLDEYVDRQLQVARALLPSPEILPPRPMQLAGVDEARAVFVRHAASGGRTVVHAQMYALSGRLVGIVTLTACDGDLKALRADFDRFVRGLVRSA